MPKIQYDYFACPNESCSAREGDVPYVVQIAEGERRRCSCGQKLTEENRVPPPTKARSKFKLKAKPFLLAGVGLVALALLILLFLPKPPVIELVESELHFEPTRPGAERRSIVTVRNVGKGLLEIHPETKGTAAFALETEDDPIFVSGGDSAEITVVFRPTNNESTEGKLLLSSNDRKAGQQEIALTGSFAVSLEEALGMFDDLDRNSKVLQKTE